jgi:hypothetical protein
MAGLRKTLYHGALIGPVDGWKFLAFVVERIFTRRLGELRRDEGKRVSLALTAGPYGNEAIVKGKNSQGGGYG